MKALLNDEPQHDFASQQEVWIWVSQGNLVKDKKFGGIYGFKNGKKWDFSKNQYNEVVFEFEDYQNWQKHTPPRLIRVNGVEVPAPLESLDGIETVYIAAPTQTDKYLAVHANSNIAQCNKKLCYATTKDAIKRAEAMLKFEIIDIEIVSPEQTKKSKDTLTSQAISHIERLNEIKDRLALSITQMAELFGVTRKSVYDWYEGAEPRSAVLNRMEILIDMLNSMPEIDLQRLKIVWNIPVSGQSFHSVFNNDNLELNALKEKINELSPRLVKKVSSLPKTTIQLGESHLAEFDRSADFT